VPRKWQTKSETIAQKGLAYGLKAIQIDGNDILAVYATVKEAMDRAREGKGGTVIEAITYRMGPHTTADDPKKYRNDEELAYWRERDPIMRFQAYLKNKGIWNEQYEAKLNEETEKIVEETVAKSEEYVPDPKTIFQYVYGPKLGLTKNLQEQMKECFEE
jgi:pyruvate dehydrogenase E1 component alpha subunit